jgi:hypothetical protein
MAGAIEEPSASVGTSVQLGSAEKDDVAEAERRRKAEAAAACTTLCLWEPDAALMIRKAKGQERARKSEYAAEARKSATAAVAAETGSSAEIRAFEEMFAVELRAARDTMDQITELERSDGETPKLFDWWREQLRELHNYVAGASTFLPTQLREKFVKSIAEHETKLTEQRERLMPRKKFGFKNRSKVGKVPAVVTGEAASMSSSSAPALPTGGGVAHIPKADTFQAPAGCQGFRDQTGATLVRATGEGMAGDFALQNLTGCEVQLLSASTALWIRGLKDCKVFAVPVKGSIYVTECEGCTLYLGARQLRIHTSKRVDFYVHASSHPILEHCTALRFAPYPSLPTKLEGAFATAGLTKEQNEWQLVDDFDWLKATHSPNWAVLPEHERLPPPSCLQDNDE